MTLQQLLQITQKKEEKRRRREEARTPVGI